MAEPLIQKVKVQPDGVKSAFAALSGAASRYTGLVSQATDKTGGLLGTIKSVAKSGKAWLIGTLVAGITAVITAIGVATAKAIGFENQLNEVRKTAGLTEREFNNLREGLLDIQADLGTSQEELAGIAAQAGRLGISGAQNIQEFTRVVAMMAEATDISASNAAQGLGKLLNAFGESIDQAEALGSVINTLSNNTAASSSEIVSAMTRIGGAASQIGLSVDEAAAFNATLQDLGVNARMSGTALRSIFGRILPQVEKVADIMGTTEQAVVQAFEENGREALLGFLEELKEMDRLSRSIATKELFGVEQSSRINLLVQNLDKVNENLGMANDQYQTADSLTTELIETTKDVANEWNRLTASLSSWVTDFGSNFTGILESALSGLVDLQGGVREVRRDMKDATTQVERLDEAMRLVARFEELRQQGEDTSDVVEELRDIMPPEFFVETADGVDVLTGRMTTFVDQLRSGVEAQRDFALQRGVSMLSERYFQLEKARKRAQAAGEDEPQQFLEAEKRARELESEIDVLAQTLVGPFADGLDVNRQALRDWIDENAGLHPMLEITKQDLDDLIDRWRTLGAEQGEATGGPPTDGGDGGPGALSDEQVRAGEEIRKIVRKIREEREAGHAVSKKEQQALQNIVDLSDRIRELQDLAAAATGKAEQRARDLIDALKDRRNEWTEIIRKRKEARDTDVTPADVADLEGGSIEERITQAGENLGQALRQSIAETEIVPLDQQDALGTITGLVEDYRDRMEQLRFQLQRGKIDQEEFAQKSQQAATDYRDMLLKIIDALEKMGLLGPKVAEEARKALEEVEGQAEDTGEQTEELGDTIQDIGRMVRGIGDVANSFGDLSDEAEGAIRATATVLDNVGRLVELAQEADSFKDIFSDFSGAISGGTAILGAAGGLVGMLTSIVGQEPALDEQQLRELRNGIKENVRALERNTEALLEQATVGENISAETIAAIDDLLTKLDDLSSMTTEGILDILAQLEETEVKAFEGIQDLFKNLRDLLIEEQPTDIRGREVISDRALRNFAVQLITGEKTPTDIAELLPEGVALSGVRDLIEQLQDVLPSDFRGLDEIFDELQDNFAEFGASIDGLIKEIRIRRDTLGQSLDELRNVIVSRLGDLGLGDPLTQGLQQALETLDLEDEDAVQTLLDQLTKAMIGEGNLSFLGLEGDLQELLGGATPAEFERLIDVLRQTLTGGGTGGEDRFTTQVAISRTITEHQANQVLSFLRELVHLGRRQRDLLGGIATKMGVRTVEQTETPTPRPSANQLRDLSGLMQQMEAPAVRVAGQKAVLAETMEVDVRVQAEDTPREIARKLEDAIRKHLRRRSQ